MPLRTARKITVALGGGVALLTALGLIALIAVLRLRSDAALVSDSQHLRSELAALDRHLREARASARSALLLRDSSYVLRYRAITDSAFQGLLAVERIARGDSETQRRVAELRPLIAERTAMLSALVDRTGRVPARLLDPLLQTELAKEELVARHISYSIAELDRLEAGRLEQRAKSQAATERATILLVMLFALVGPGLAALMWRSIKSDLETRARAEDELRASEAKFAGILAIAIDGIVTIDETHTIQHFNAGAEQIFGYSSAEVLGRPLEMLLPEHLASTHRDHVHAFARAPEQARKMGERRQVMGRRKDGKVFPAEASISKLGTPAGMLFTVVLRDVTDQRRREQQEHLLATAGKALIDTLEVDAVLRASAALAVPELGAWAVLDIMDDESGRPSFQRVCATNRPDLEHALHSLERHTLSADSPSRAIDVIRSGNAEIVDQVTADWLESHADAPELPALRALRIQSLLVVPLTLSGRTHGALTVGRDERRKPYDERDVALAQELADRAALAIDIARSHHRSLLATRARDEILAIVSHDLRNPMSAVSMCARRLIEDPPADANELRALYHSILDASDWTHRLVQDLLDAASIDAGKLSVELESQSVPQLVEAAIEFFDGRARSQGVALAADVPPDTPLVKADGARIVQVLSNLLSNAIKYSGDGQRVVVGARPDGDSVVLTVQDFRRGNRRLGSAARLRSLLAQARRSQGAVVRTRPRDRARDRLGARRPDLGGE